MIDHVGLDRWRKGQVETEQKACQQADDAERAHVAAAEKTRQGEDRTGRQHRAAPCAVLAEAAGGPRPQRDAEHRAGEIDEKQRPAPVRRTQPVGYEIEEQGGRMPWQIR